MKKEKQIKEMTQAIGKKQVGGWKFVGESERTIDIPNEELAEHLINKGYRKASKVAKEIGDEIAKNLMQVTAIPNYVVIEVHTLISIINKYTE